MKSILNIVLLLLTAIVVLNGCESNTGFADADQYAKVYMPQAREQPAEYPLVMVDTVQTIIYGAAYGGPSELGSDIEVHFNVDSSLVDSFNTSMGTSYEVMPEESYKLSQTTAVIPAGETSTEPLELSITTIGAIQPAIEYLLPISIEAEGSIGLNPDLQTTYFFIQGNYIEFDRSGWAIHDVDSEQGEPAPAPATNILDGDPATFWHSVWSVRPQPPLPHHITVDMGETQKVHGVRIIGRQGFTRGDPEVLEIAVSSDGETWGNGESFTTTFNINTAEGNEDIFYLSSAVEGQYIKVTVTDSYGEEGLPITHFAEAYAF